MNNLKKAFTEIEQNLNRYWAELNVESYLKEIKYLSQFVLEVSGLTTKKYLIKSILCTE